MTAPDDVSAPAGGPQAEGTGERKGERARAVPPPPRRGPFLVAGLAVLGLLGYGGYGHWQRRAAAAETQHRAREFVPQVRTVEAARDDGPVRLTLPGSTQAYASTALYARATGYVAERRVDIGSRVREGDLLLRIAAPDLDQQLAQAQAQYGQMEALLTQARAGVDQARSGVNLANVTNARTATLATQGWATQQNADTSSANVQTSGANLAAADAGVKVAEANLRAQGATVDRLKALAGFENVVAPFDGVVTSRSVDVGNLVNADAGGGAALFTMDRDDILRIATDVPQNLAVGMADGVPASMRVPQLPGREFSGRVARTSVSLLTSARTLTTQIDIPNADRALRPGLFVDVTFAIPRTHPDVTVPSEALVFDHTGPHVALVEGEDTVRMRPVTIERDLGTSLSLREGLEGGETVVLSPPVGLRDGGRVRIAPGDRRPGDATRHEASR